MRSSYRSLGRALALLASSAVIAACGSSSQTHTRNGVLALDTACWKTQEEQQARLADLADQISDSERAVQNARETGSVLTQFARFEADLENPEDLQKISDLQMKLDQVQAVADKLPMLKSAYDEAEQRPICAPTTPSTDSGTLTSEVPSTDAAPAPTDGSSMPPSTDSPPATVSTSDTPTRAIDECPTLQPKEGTNIRANVGEEVTLTVPDCTALGDDLTVWYGMPGPIDLVSNVRSGSQTVFTVTSKSAASADIFLNYANSRTFESAPRTMISLTFLDGSDLCDGKKPTIKNMDGTLVFTATCDSANGLWMKLCRVTKTGCTEIWSTSVESGRKYEEFLRYEEEGTYRVSVQHVQSNDMTMLRLGDQARIELEKNPTTSTAVADTTAASDPGSSAPTDETTTAAPDSSNGASSDPSTTVPAVNASDNAGVANPLPVIALSPKFGDTKAEASAPPAIAPVVAVGANTEVLTCDSSCIDSLVSASGVEMKSIEYAVDGGSWSPLSPDSRIFLANGPTNVSVRVTPKSGV